MNRTLSITAALALSCLPVWAQLQIQIGQPVFANYLAPNVTLTNVNVSGGIMLGIGANIVPTSTNSAYIVAVANGSGTAEVVTKDGAGTVHQFSEHDMDAPPSLIDTNDPFPNVSMERNDYFGLVRWTNRSRQSTIANLTMQLQANSYEAWLGIQAGSNVGLLQNNATWANYRTNWATSSYGTNWYLAMKSFVVMNAAGLVTTSNETYAAYNARLGLTTNSPGYLRASSWSADTGGQPMPGWMQVRGANP